MKGSADTFVPVEVGECWFGSRPCPGCDAHTLHPVANLAPSRWLCSNCGRCWEPRHGHLDRVDPWTCGGCATRDRRECILRLQRDEPHPELALVTPESRDERDRSMIDHWELLARVARAQALICAQADCSADDALVLMQTRARETDHLVVEIAEEVLAHRIWFD